MTDKGQLYPVDEVPKTKAGTKNYAPWLDTLNEFLASGEETVRVGDYRGDAARYTANYVNKVAKKNGLEAKVHALSRKGHLYLQRI